MAYIREYTWYWHEGIEGGGWRVLETPAPFPGYDYIPPPVGTEIYLGPGWMNDSDVPVTGHLVVRISSPAGVLHDYFTPEETLDPHKGKATTLPPFALDEAGTWKMEVWLIIDDVAQDYKSVDFATEAPVGIPTNLTITAPDTINEEEMFNIITTLTTQAGAPLSGMETVLTVPEIPDIILSAYTGVNGTCEFMLSLPQGTYTLRADFAGTETYNSSRVMGTIRATSPIAGALQIAGSTVTGLALFVYGIS